MFSLPFSWQDETCKCIKSSDHSTESTGKPERSFQPCQPYEDPAYQTGEYSLFVTFSETVQYPSPCIAKKAGSITFPRLSPYSDQHRFSTHKINT